MRTHAKCAPILIVLLALTDGSGCATCWRHRGEDFADMMDLGVTWSQKPRWAFYNSFESLVCLGYADHEADLYGWGGGRFGKTPHYLKAWGLLAWGDERVGWAPYDREDPDTLYAQTVGLIGAPAGLITGRSNPHYVPT